MYLIDVIEVVKKVILVEKQIKNVLKHRQELERVTLNVPELDWNQNAKNLLCIFGIRILNTVNRTQVLIDVFGCDISDKFGYVEHQNIQYRPNLGKKCFISPFEFATFPFSGLLFVGKFQNTRFAPCCWVFYSR